MLFAPKSADVRIWKPSLVYTGQTPSPDCGRLLWKAPYRYFLSITCTSTCQHFRM